MAKSDGTVYVDTKIDTSGFGKGMADAKQKVSAFSGSLNKLGNTIKNTFSQSNTVNVGKSYDELRKEIAKAESQLDKLIEKQIRFVETGGNTKSRTMEGMEYDIEMARNRLEELRSQLSLTSKETPKKVGKMNAWIERLKKSFDSLNKTTKKSHRSILTMLGTSLLFSTVFRAISTVTKGFTEGINNLAQYSDKANGTMSALKSSLTQLKNSFATAFMPIITAVTPAITQFMSLISKATSIVAAFLSALTGNKTYTKAIEVQEDYAASLDKTADSAKKAQKYLSGLDEIRTFTEKNDDTSGVVLPENMFTEENIDSSILDFADKVKEVINKIKTFIKNEDWEGLGSYISDGIVGALDFLSDKLDEFDWEGLGEDIGEFLAGIEWLEIIKSAFKLKFNIWKAIAKVWFGMFKAAPIETAILTAIAALKFTPLGGILATAIAKAITGAGFVSAISGAFTSLGGLGGIFTMDLATIFGTGTAAEIGLALGSYIIGGLLAAFVGNEIGKKIGAAIFPDMKEEYENFKWFGEGGFFDEIFSNDLETHFDAFVMMSEDGNGLLGVLSKIKEEITGTSLKFEDMFLGLEELIEIYSPLIENWFEESVQPWLTKEKWKELGENIKSGLVSKWEEFKTSWQNTAISKWFEEDVKPWFTKEKWSEAMGGIKEAFSKTWKGAVNVAIELLNKFIDYLNEKMHFEWDGLTIMGKEIFPSGSMQLFTIPNIPMLATGAVIPPNAPFMAVLGDQKHGTNIEAPLDTIKQAVREVVGGGTGGQYQFTAQINRRTLFDEFIEEAKLRQSMSGRSPFDLA